MDFKPLIEQFFPLILLISGGFCVLFLGIIKSPQRIRTAGFASAVLFAVTGLSFICQFDRKAELTLNHLIQDPFANFLGILICLVGLVVSLLAKSQFKKHSESVGEIFALLNFSAAGMILMVQTQNLLSFVIGLELMSLAIYVLVGVKRRETRAAEASMKYFLLGSIASAFLLMGIALLYGAHNSLDLMSMLQNPVHEGFENFKILGLIFLLLGILFKIGAVPFHFWIPDVYDGASYSVTCFMSTGVKIAAFGGFLRILPLFNLQEQVWFRDVLAAMIVASLIVSNIAALRQKSLKRILAYSSISHAAYLMMGLLAYSQAPQEDSGLSSLLFYLAVYTLMTLGVFVILGNLAKSEGETEALDDLNGLATRRPFVAALMAVFLFSLAGIPPTAGFMAKFYLFRSVIEQGMVPLAIVGVLMSAVSFYYYIAPVVRMYFKPSEPSSSVVWINPLALAWLAVLALGIVYFGIRPEIYIQMVKTAQISSLL